jgi:nicotinamide-nucleotide adenylyltransferase
MRALFVGRFQPFHNGHFSMLKKAVAEADSVIVVIGSAQYFNTKENPFSSGERMLMINRALRTLKVKEYYIVPIEDVGNDELWASKIEEFCPKFDIVYTNNSITAEIFAKKGYEVKKPGLLKRNELSGTTIRRLIADGKNWADFVPNTTAEEINRISGVNRIQMLFK